MALRLGERPRVLISTTPRPLPLIRSLLESPTCIVRRESTFANAHNLPASALAEFRSRYEGTRIGRQELHAEILDDVEGALWTRAMLDESRVREVPELVRIVVGVDPAVTSGEDSDSTGIVVAGRAASGHLYVLADRTCRLSPLGWAQRVASVYEEFRCDRVIAEANNGGDMVEATLRTVNPNIPFTKVVATRGKRTRAEPIAALYEQRKVHHAQLYSELEDQMCTFAPDVTTGSPDRVDALCWALSSLLVAEGEGYRDFIREGVAAVLADRERKG
jgi:phage terminase large subunit-like protein